MPLFVVHLKTFILNCHNNSDSVMYLCCPLLDNVVITTQKHYNKHYYNKILCFSDKTRKDDSSKFKPDIYSKTLVFIGFY